MSYLEKRSTAFVKFSMVLSASPCSIPSRTQCWIWPSKTTWPTLCSADFAALIWERTSSQGTSSSTIRSMACTWPMIFSNGGANYPRPYIVSSFTPPVQLRDMNLLFAKSLCLSRAAVPDGLAQARGNLRPAGCRAQSFWLHCALRKTERTAWGDGRHTVRGNHKQWLKLA